MKIRFLDYELDTAGKELRRGDERIDLQPRVYATLEYLVRHRDRAVSKEELLREVWPDVIVSDSSVQRAVSLLRSALGHGEAIRTVPRHGYRFAARVNASRPTTSGQFRPRFVQSDGVHVAFHTIGEGDVDLVVIPGWVFPLRAFLDQPEIAVWLEELSRFGRVVLFDKRGTGLSDRVKELPTIEQRVDDLRAVLDAIGSRKALLIGASEGGPLALVYAASFPERVQGLLLCSSFARWSSSPDHPHGWTRQVVAGLRRYVGTNWGRGDTIRAIVQSRADEPAITEWAARTEQEGASPGAARELMEMNLRVDVRNLLPSITVPTVVFHHRHDSVISVDCGRFLAEQIPGARWVAGDGVDHMPFFQGRELFFDSVAWLLGQTREPVDRFLTTILALRPHGSSPASPESFGGTPTGREGTWSFDGPQRAIRCGLALVAADDVDSSGIHIGIHIGEVERRIAARGGLTGGQLKGNAIEVACAIANSAPAGEVWVARVVRDLVYGSSLCFQPRGDVDLGGGRTVAVLAGSSGKESSMADQPEVRLREGS